MAGFLGAVPAAGVVLDRVRPGLGHRLIWESLVGALHARRLMTRAPVQAGFPEDVADLLLLGIARQPSAP